MNLRKVPFAMAVLLFCISFILWFFCNKPRKRCVFVFKSSDLQHTVIEERYIISDIYVKSYVDELLLGPSIEHCAPLFSPGTRALSCFLKDDILYVNFSEALLREYGGITNIKENIELFKKNIKRNFSGIKQIELFVCGNEI